MSLNLQVIDNFFSEKEFNIIQSNISKLDLKIMTNENGIYGFRHTFEKDKDNEWMFAKIKQAFFRKKDLHLKHASYHLRHNNKKVMSHTDGPDYNFILYLKGQELVYNGTGFYDKNNNLNTYVGFVENRALFFDGKNNVHTDLQALGESSPRHTLNIFYDHKKI
tara:strand:+ start:589 stop:1080 length:492 start_codon:yes stop_codon:yes gene_type:complete